MKGLFNWLNKTKVFRDLSPQEFSWVLYDVGNSAYTMLACSLIPIWFKELAIGTNPGQITGDQATAYYSIAISIVTVIVALLGPVLGALADRKESKKIFFQTTVAAGVIGCVLNSFTWSWMLFLIVYVLTKVFYQASLTFYDSMLNDVTTEERMDQVSSYGYAWGYIGSCIPFLIAMVAYILSGGLSESLMLFSPMVGKIIGFGVTAIWWLLVTLPLIKNYQQKNYVEHTHTTVGQVFKKIFGTFKKIAVRDKKVLFFLIAFFLYIDGVGTIIDNCINIGTDLGLPTVGQVVFLLATQVVAWIGSLVFAKLSKKYGRCSTSAFWPSAWAASRAPSSPCPGPTTPRSSRLRIPASTSVSTTSSARARPSWAPRSSPGSSWRAVQSTSPWRPWPCSSPWASSS